MGIPISKSSGSQITGRLQQAYAIAHDLCEKGVGNKEVKRNLREGGFEDLIQQVMRQLRGDDLVQPSFPDQIAAEHALNLGATSRRRNPSIDELRKHFENLR